MVELTKQTLASIRALFQSSDVESAERALTEHGNRLQPTEGEDALPERIQLAAVRFSGGRLPDLTLALQLAEIDWRDLLVGAGFADDPNAHAHWAPRPLEAQLVNLWLGGDLLPGVTFGPSQLVSVHFAAGPDQQGSITRLTGLEPVPRYLVKLQSGEHVEVFQQQLAPSG